MDSLCAQCRKNLLAMTPLCTTCADALICKYGRTGAQAVAAAVIAVSQPDEIANIYGRTRAQSKTALKETRALLQDARQRGDI